MPITVDWYDEDENIILIRHSGIWNVTELAASNQTLNQLAEQTTSRFDTISDLTDSAFTPPVGLLWEWKQNVTTRERAFPHWYLSVFVVANPVLEAYFKAGFESSEIVQRHARMTKTIEEAVMLIIADRKSAVH